jgi:hypothetical protein
MSRIALTTSGDATVFGSSGRKTTEPVDVSLGCGDLNILANDLALLISGQKGDIGGVSAAADPDDAFNWRQARGIDKPPAIFEIDLEDGVKIR